MDREGSKLPSRSASITTLQRTADSPSTVLFCLKHVVSTFLALGTQSPHPQNTRPASTHDDKRPAGALHSPFAPPVTVPQRIHTSGIQGRRRGRRLTPSHVAHRHHAHE